MTNAAASAASHQTRDRAVQVVAFLVYGGLWVAFAGALLADASRLGDVWAWVTSQPVPLQLVLWFLFLPVMAGLWAWQTDWVLAVRLVVVAGLAAWTAYMFAPRWLLGGRRHRLGA